MYHFTISYIKIWLEHSEESSAILLMEVNHGEGSHSTSLYKFLSDILH